MTLAQFIALLHSEVDEFQATWLEKSQTPGGAVAFPTELGEADDPTEWFEQLMAHWSAKGLVADR